TSFLVGSAPWISIPLLRLPPRSPRLRVESSFPPMRATFSTHLFASPPHLAYHPLIVLQSPRNSFRAAPRYQPILREIGLDAETIFTHPDIKIWRSITERENCTLDADLSDGRRIRLHIKRYHPARGF